VSRVVLRTGIDLLDIDRLNSVAPNIRARFLNRVFTQKELEQSKDSNPSLAGLFCVKEAVSKALGCGIGVIGWKEIETLTDTQGAPCVTLYGKAARLAEETGLSTWTVSISHTKQVAAASVTAIGFIPDHEDPLR
jgi:holo-[acyl-carrier protein] synthase